MTCVLALSVSDGKGGTAIERIMLNLEAERARLQPAPCTDRVFTCVNLAVKAQALIGEVAGPQALVKVERRSAARTNDRVGS